MPTYNSELKDQMVRKMMPPNGETVAGISREAGQLFHATRVLSYWVLYFTLYSLGLRLGEGLWLEVGDIDAPRNPVLVFPSRQGGI